MADRPIYPKELEPKNWENAKGTLAKAVIKTDVKGALDKASKFYWDSVPWDRLENAEHLSPDVVAAAVAKVDTLLEAVAAVETNALQAMREIDKVPANKLTMRASRAYLDTMGKQAKKFSDAAHAYAASVAAVHDKQVKAEKQAEANFNGWMALNTKNALELVTECEMRCKAGIGAFSTKPHGSAERIAAQNGQLKYADDLIAALQKIYTDADAKYHATNKVEQLMWMQKYKTFQAAEAAQLNAMAAARADLAAK